MPRRKKKIIVVLKSYYIELFWKTEVSSAKDEAQNASVLQQTLTALVQNTYLYKSNAIRTIIIKDWVSIPLKAMCYDHIKDAQVSHSTTDESAKTRTSHNSTTNINHLHLSSFEKLFFLAYLPSKISLP